MCEKGVSEFQLDFSVRLSLERCSSASEVVTVIGGLAEQHGPDGVEGVGKQCFIVADSNEVWIVNVVGKLWAAESIDSKHITIVESDRNINLTISFLSAGCRRIPAALTVTTKIDKSSENLPTKVQDLNLWNGEVSRIDFSNVKISMIKSKKIIIYNFLFGIPIKKLKIQQHFFFSLFFH